MGACPNNARNSMNTMNKSDTENANLIPQPEPFTPGISKGQVRQHALELYRDKLTHDSLTIEDWVTAEKDLVDSMQSDNVSR